ncbi:MAG: hypothetical protein V3R66_07250, partial [Rhodospirillales bacterium]
MTVSSADMPSRLFFAVCLALLLAAPGRGWSQQSGPVAGPVRLTPIRPLVPAPDEKPEPARPGPAPQSVIGVPGGPGAGDGGAVTTGVTPGGPGVNVEVDTLTTINPDAAGALTEDQGGFPASMWRGTSRRLVDSLLVKLPVNTASMAMRGLMRRLLLSAAVVPQGAAEPGALVALRVRLLADMGDFVGVNQLLNAIPGRDLNPDLVFVEANSRFLANDNARACVLAAGQIRTQENAFWHKAFIFCQALAGETDKAALGVELLREMGEDDQAFYDLVDSLSGGGVVSIESLADPSPLHLAMARVAKAQLPPDVISSNRPSILNTIATSPNAPVELRMEAAERAEAAGALPVEALRQLYTSVSFSDEDLANPLSKAEAESGPLSRALLYRTALIQTVPTAQAEAVSRALSLAREGGRYASTVRVFTGVLKNIPPSPELLWFAPEAVRAFLFLADHESADVWFGLLSSSAMFDRQAGLDLKALMPLARLSDS